MLRQQIYERVANLQAELAALMRLLAEFGEIVPAPAASASPPPVEVPMSTPSSPLEAVPEVGRHPSASGHLSTKKAPAVKLRWRYLPGTWYRICGPSPFRAGNHANLFQRMKDLYGDKPWPRERLVEAFLTLKASGQFDTIQDDDTALLQFMRLAGPLKGSVEMSQPDFDESEAPVVAAPPRAVTRRRPAAAAEALPPEPGDGMLRLVGDSPFRDGSIYALVWGRLGGGAFSREQAVAAVESLVREGALETSRKAEVVVRDFLGRLQERGHLAR